MERATRFLIKHIELLAVLLILGSVLLINFFVVQKITMIAFYFLPVLVAGYTQGKRLALLTALFSVAVVVFWAVIDPRSFALPADSVHLYVHLGAWGGFLVLSAAVVGRLYAEKEKRLVDVRAAYAGVLEILFAYLDSPRKRVRRHVGRVAEMAGHIAKRIGMSDEEIEGVRTAALLHEIGTLRVPIGLVRRAASLSLKEKRMMEMHCQEGGDVLKRLGAVLRQALPTVTAHQELCAADRDALDLFAEGSTHVQILHIADAYDVLTQAQGLCPADAASEILRTVHVWVRPDILDAFAEVATLSQPEPGARRVDGGGERKGPCPPPKAPRPMAALCARRS